MMPFDWHRALRW